MKMHLFYRGSTSIRVPDWKPIENTSTALFAEYHRLYDRWWHDLPGGASKERQAIKMQMDNICAELQNRNFFEALGQASVESQKWTRGV